MSRRHLLLAGAAAIPAWAAFAAAPPPVRRIEHRLEGEGALRLGCDDRGITSLTFRRDAFPTDYVRAGARLGRVLARVRRGDGAWRLVDTATRPARRSARTIAHVAQADGAVLASRLTPTRDGLAWEIVLRNDGRTPIEVGDLFVPLPMPTDFMAKQPLTASVMKHSFVSGHGSHVFWMRANSVGPYLLLMPDRATQLEYWEVRRLEEGARTWCAFLHAGAAEAEARAGGTRWRLPTGSARLGPGEERRYGFRLVGVADYAAAREAIAEAGLIDVEVVPGMTVPRDLHVDLALRSAVPVDRIEPEHGDATTIEPLPPRGGRQLYRIRFARLGENRLTLHQPGGRRTYLEFFATEPVETMLRKRAAFIVRRQHRDPAAWYDGLFGEWNMATGVLLGPDNYDRIKGWRIYEVTCDDPGLSKPAFLASKNAELPDQAEVAALDTYIARFVWGGLQRTDAETYPFAIYGIPDWRRNRTSADPGPKGRLHLWRPYDYPHIVTMYLGMHRVARDHAQIRTALAAHEYLRRAYRTADAMFTVPKALIDWSADDTGFYNECVIPGLVRDLERAGMAAEAATLQAHWARKVRRFVGGEVDLFGSEYPFDSTGFESTQALARSALDAPAAMGVTPAAARAFADRQMRANLFCRGWLEPAYYYLGSDYRGSGGDAYTLTYMAQMGGWAVLNHALYDAADPHPLLRLGYASVLSAWALLNSGGAADGHGYWYPGAAHDGAAAGGFEPAPFGVTWLDQPHRRGAWYYSCEIDLGFCGATRAAATILADDPVFGRVCYGGAIVADATPLRVIPRDGIRRRLHARLHDAAFDLVLTDARFRAETPLALDPATRTLAFAVEPFAADATTATVELRRPGGGWETRRVAVADGRATVVWG